MPQRIAKKSADRRGHTLLEVIVAASVMVVAIVPALKLIRDSMELSRELETRQLLTTLGVGQLDRELSTAAASWSLTSTSGDFASEGYANLHYSTTRSDDPADGALVDQLMSIRVTVWDDQNNDGSPSSGEPQEIFRSKIAKLASYEAEAAP